MPLPARFTDELRARTPLAAVIGRRVRLARSGKQWKGNCPFHGEKSPSFYVYDDHYHCFGCGAHGDAISFVMQSQSVAFMDAVTQLAAEAGLDVPQPSPEAAETERRRLDVVGVLQAAQHHFQRRLGLPEGRTARDYLLGRGLTEDTISRFGLGWCGDRGGLISEMGRQGIELSQLEDAGLVRRDDETARSFEFFSNRVMFPIRDRRGAIISFGGRILGAGQPKYVNGPETAVFAKRRTLFGLDGARDAVRGGGTLVVVEGYMDVIVAAQAGFAGAVAPLGTALTNEHLEELWRMSPCPVLCFDGDAAGSRAAARAMELALPLLTAERSLKFAALDAGEDPDSLVRKRGSAAFQAVLDAAQTPSDALYDMVRGSAGEATPEQRAALLGRLMEAANRIGDKALAGEYRRVLKERFYGSRQPWPPAQRGQGGQRTGLAEFRAGFQRPAARTIRFVRARIDQIAVEQERSRILTAILLRHPFLLRDVQQAFATLTMDTSLSRLREAMLNWAEAAETLDFAALTDHLTKSGFSADVEQVVAVGAMPLPGCAMATAMPAQAETGWWLFFGFLNVERLREEVASAKLDADRNLTSETERRLKALREALIRVESGEPDGVGLADA